MSSSLSLTKIVTEQIFPRIYPQQQPLLDGTLGDLVADKAGAAARSILVHLSAEPLEAEAATEVATCFDDCTELYKHMVPGSEPIRPLVLRGNLERYRNSASGRCPKAIADTLTGIVVVGDEFQAAPANQRSIFLAHEYFHCQGAIRISATEEHYQHGGMTPGERRGLIYRSRANQLAGFACNETEILGTALEEAAAGAFTMAYASGVRGWEIGSRTQSWDISSASIASKESAYFIGAALRLYSATAFSSVLGRSDPADWMSIMKASPELKVKVESKIPCALHEQGNFELEEIPYFLAVRDLLASANGWTEQTANTNAIRDLVRASAAPLSSPHSASTGNRALFGPLLKSMGTTGVEFLMFLNASSISSLFLRMFADAGGLSADCRGTMQNLIVEHAFWAARKERVKFCS